jgi:hypothetical protein
MIRFHVDHVWYQLPTSWSEIDPERLLATMLIVYSEGRTTRGRLKVLQVLNPVPAKVFRKFVPWQVNDMCRLLDWVFDTPVQQKPFESFVHNQVEYFLPQEQLQAVTLLEFQSAVAYLYQFYYAPEDRAENMTKLVATLCRPAAGQDVESPEFTGDLREKFNEHVVKSRATKFLDLPAGVTAAILQYFISQFRWLYDTYDVFEKSADANPEAPEPAADEFEWVEQLVSLRNLAYAVAETKLLGNLREVENSPVTLVFEALEHMKEKRENAPQNG